MSEELIAIEVGASLVDPERARADAEDLAWDHAKFAASVADVSLDSNEFEFLFAELRKRYSMCAEHLEFLTFNALVMLRALLNSEHVALTQEFPITDTDLAATLCDMAHTVVSSYAWIIAGQDLLWPTNDNMPGVGVTFKFPVNDIIITEGQ